MEIFRRLNNRGVSMLAKGDTRTAIVDFTKALKVAKQILNMNHQAAATDNEYDEKIASSSTTTLSLDHCMVLSCDNMATFKDSFSENAKVEEDQSSFMYRQATLIPHLDATSAPEGTDETILVIVMFNLALAHHQHANDYGSRAPEVVPLLKKTIKLYELTSITYQNRVMTATANTVADDLFFLMALMNNLAVVKYALQDVVAVGRCFQHLLSILMVVIDMGDLMRQDANNSVAAWHFLRDMFEIFLI